MRAFVLSMFVEITGIGVNPLPVVLLQVIVALPVIPDVIYAKSMASLYLDEKLSPTVVSVEVQEIPYELYLAGQ